MDVSIVVPVYGCRAALPELYNRISYEISKLFKTYEIIFVNDSCPQNSWEVIENICKNDKHVKGIELSRNFGQMKAILAGLDCSKGDWVVVMDCDLQDRPEEIKRLYHKAKEGYDVVFARRKKRSDGKIKVLLANCFYNIYSYATDGTYDGAVCNFSIVKRNVVNSFCQMREQHRAYVMYMKWLGYRQATIDVEHDERYEGESSYTLKKRINMAIELLTSQSDKILRLFVSFGFILSVVSLLCIVFLVVNKLLFDVAIGWTSLLSTIVLFGGLIIMVIGVVGIYVGNIFMQVKNRPLYIVRQILNEDDESEIE